MPSFFGISMTVAFLYRKMNLAWPFSLCVYGQYMGLCGLMEFFLIDLKLTFWLFLLLAISPPPPNPPPFSLFPSFFSLSLSLSISFSPSMIPPNSRPLHAVRFVRNAHAISLLLLPFSILEYNNNTACDSLFTNWSRRYFVIRIASNGVTCTKALDIGCNQ